jgi:hypothetical protein
MASLTAILREGMVSHTVSVYVQCASVANYR